MKNLLHEDDKQRWSQEGWFSTTLSRVWESLLGIQNAIEEGYWFDTLFERGLGHLPTPPREITSVFGLQWEGSGRESLTRFIPLRLKPTGSADLSKRAAKLRFRHRAFSFPKAIESKSGQEAFTEAGGGSERFSEYLSEWFQDVLRDDDSGCPRPALKSSIWMMRVRAPWYLKSVTVGSLRYHKF